MSTGPARVVFIEHLTPVEIFEALPSEVGTSHLPPSQQAALLGGTRNGRYRLDVTSGCDAPLVHCSDEETEQRWAERQTDFSPWRSHTRTGKGDFNEDG
jgi:hypothetical protein